MSRCTTGINDTGGKLPLEGKNVSISELYFPKVSKHNN